MKLKILSFIVLTVVCFDNATACSGGDEEEKKETTDAPTVPEPVPDDELNDKINHTSIIVYDKHKLTREEVLEEVTRIEAKCTELGCPCNVTKLEEIGVLGVEWGCDNHPAYHLLDLKDGLEVGGEDDFLGAFNSPPPTDPRFRNQWALSIPRLSNKADINIEEGWKEYLSDAKGGNANGPSVVVAVIDTGVDYNHPDLKDVMWTNPNETPNNGRDDDGNGIVDDYYGADYTRNTRGTGDPIDRNGHGTHCAGIIAAKPNNGEGIAGVASFTKAKVKIMALKGLDDGGSGDTFGLLECLNYAIKHGAKISSNSWGGGRLNSQTERIWDEVLKNNLDHLFVAAAGNDNSLVTKRSMTCGLEEPNLLCVASSTEQDSRSRFSNYGTAKVHVFAPGSSIFSTYPRNRYTSLSGTSMACPQVSGLAALIMTMRAGMTAQEVRKVIEDNVQKKSQYTQFVSSGGLIDVGKTIKALKSGGGVPNPPGGDSKTVTVQTVTKQWGREVTWTLSTCSNERTYQDDKTYSQDCGLPAGTHTLTCKDTYGDGWNGGYLRIGGTDYCKTFTDGFQKTESVSVA